MTMRGDPSSPEERESADDTQLHVEPLPGPERGGIGARFLKLPGSAITAHPQLARTLSAGALVTLLVVLTLLVWLPPFSALLPLVIAPTSTATPRQFGAPEIPQGTGWQPAGPSVAQGITFAPSDSAISCSCAAPEFSSLDKPVPIILDISRDHGRTWQSLPTPAQGVWRALSVNPTDASDVALVGVLCPPGQATPTASAAPNVFEVYRSFDGGATWRSWPLPAASGVARFAWYQWAWAGSTLFVAPYVDGEKGYMRLAASTAGQPFVWVEQRGLFAGAPSDARINDLIGSPTGLYLDLISQNCALPADCFRTMQTRDGGASWSRFMGQYQGQPVYLDQNQVATGATPFLFGEVVDPTDPSEERRTYVHSEDGGFSWRPLVAPPRHLIITQVAHIPDKTLYAELWPFPGTRLESAAPGVYALAPGVDKWRFVAAYPHGGGWITVSWDQQGHALALWSGLTTPTANYPQIGLETHAP
jgi:hypothetical protein